MNILTQSFYLIAVAKKLKEFGVAEWKYEKLIVTWKVVRVIEKTMNSLEKVWARATGHLMGHTDDDRPDVPVLTLREARVALFLKTFWVIIHVVTCFFIIANTIRHW